MAKYEACKTGKCGEISWVKYTQRYKVPHEGAPDKELVYEMEYADCGSLDSDPCKGDCNCFIVVTANGESKENLSHKDPEHAGEFTATITYKDDDIDAYLPWSRNPTHDDTRSLSKSELDTLKKSLAPAALTLRCACLMTSKP